MNPTNLFPDRKAERTTGAQISEPTVTVPAAFLEKLQRELAALRAERAEFFNELHEKDDAIRLRDRALRYVLNDAEVPL